MANGLNPFDDGSGDFSQIDDFPGQFMGDGGPVSRFLQTLGILGTPAVNKGIQAEPIPLGIGSIPPTPQEAAPLPRRNPRPTAASKSLLDQLNTPGDIVDPEGNMRFPVAPTVDPVPVAPTVDPGNMRFTTGEVPNRSPEASAAPTTPTRDDVYVSVPQEPSPVQVSPTGTPSTANEVLIEVIKSLAGSAPQVDLYARIANLLRGSPLDVVGNFAGNVGQDVPVNDFITTVGEQTPEVVQAIIQALTSRASPEQSRAVPNNRQRGPSRTAR